MIQTNILKKQENTEKYLERSLTFNLSADHKVSPAFLFAGGVLILGAAAIIIGLYLPEHMPIIIEKAVQHLNQASFYTTLIAAILLGGSGLYLLGREAKKLDINSVSFYNLKNDDTRTETEHTFSEVNVGLQTQ